MRLLSVEGVAGMTAPYAAPDHSQGRPALVATARSARVTWIGRDCQATPGTDPFASRRTG